MQKKEHNKSPEKAFSDVKWTSSNKDVAVVTFKAVVTAKKKGNVTITATSKTNKKVKAKLKYADKFQIPYVIIVGEYEINSGVISVKNMITGEEKKANILENGKNINVEEIVSIINQ